MKPFKLKLLKGEQLLYEGEVRYIKLPGREGELGILADHAPMFSLLKGGEIEIELADSGQRLKFPLDKGIFRICGNEAVGILF
jgi:F-type H+-transporting ATPase subunit epsilon